MTALMILHRHVLEPAEAAELGRDALARAEQRGVEIAVAVVDAWGRALYLTQTTRSVPGSTDVALELARTAATFVRPSSDIERQVADGRSGALTLHGATTLAGGVPLRHGAQVIGAVGVHGGDPEIAERVATEVADSVRLSALPLRPSLSAIGAQRVVEAVSAEANRLTLAPIVAVVDPGGVLMAIGRPDGAQPASIAVATDKARTAALFRRPSGDFERAARERLSILRLPGAVALEGGIPLVLEAHVVGAVGVSGASSPAQDTQLAAVGVEAFRRGAGAATA